MWVLVLTLTAFPAHAAADLCVKGSPDAIAIAEWSAEAAKDAMFSNVSLTLHLRNETGKDIRLIDGSVLFQDALGASLGSVAIERDVLLPAGKIIEQTGSYIGSDLDRLLALSREDVVLWSCTRAAVFTDGTKVAY